MAQLRDATGIIVDDHNYTETPDFDFGSAEVVEGGEVLDESVAEFVTVATGSVEEFFGKFQALDLGAESRDLDSEDVLKLLKDGSITIETDLEDLAIYDDYDALFDSLMETHDVDPEGSVAILLYTRVDQEQVLYYFFAGDAIELPSGKFYVVS